MKRGDLGGSRVDVADEARLGPVHADVDDRRARLHHLGRDEPGEAGRDHEHVRVEGVAREIVRLRVAERHGRVRLHQQVEHRLADDVRPADDDRPPALERHAVLGEQRHDPGGVPGTIVGRPR